VVPRGTRVALARRRTPNLATHDCAGCTRRYPSERSRSLPTGTRPWTTELVALSPRALTGQERLHQHLRDIVEFRDALHRHSIHARSGVACGVNDSDQMREHPPRHSTWRVHPPQDDGTLVHRKPDLSTRPVDNHSMPGGIPSAHPPIPGPTPGPSHGARTRSWHLTPERRTWAASIRIHATELHACCSHGTRSYWPTRISRMPLV
jgi:hypothetical protein